MATTPKANENLFLNILAVGFRDNLHSYCPLSITAKYHPAGEDGWAGAIAAGPLPLAPAVLFLGDHPIEITPAVSPVRGCDYLLPRN
jgi:hypothetical protein